MKKILFAFAILLFSFTSNAQKINITESTEEVDKIQRTGLGAIVDLDKKALTKSWEKFLKNYGKLESSKGIYTIQLAKIPTISSQPCKIIAEIKSTKKGMLVWWAIDTGTHFVTTSTDKSAYKAAEKLLYDFIYNAYVEDVNEQVKDAEKAHANSVKSYEKEVKNGEKLVSDVEKNRKEKAKLEKALEDNAKEHDQLLKDIEGNKKDQKTASEEAEKMKKAVDVVKAKLNAIGK
ncbi:MAG: hypothetical protein ACK4ND_04465 [Cytophagaceae bacterium]